MLIFLSTPRVFIVLHVHLILGNFLRILFRRCICTEHVITRGEREGGGVRGEREREGGSERERETERERDRQADRQTETERQRQRETETESFQGIRTNYQKNG